MKNTDEVSTAGRPLFLAGPYFPDHNVNRMGSEGNVRAARETFLASRFPNLEWLLKERYEWMNDYLRAGQMVLELGCGAGFSPLYLSVKPILTDTVDNDWVERKLDAMDMALEDSSVDVLIASHTIHHFYSPHRFFHEALRAVKPGGYLLIQEINTSFLMRILLRLMRHEGWSYDVDVFDSSAVANNPDDPWSGNCAIPLLLFQDSAKFEQVMRQDGYFWRVIRNECCECLLFPFSGGVIAKTRVPKLPVFLLNMLKIFDKFLSVAAPSVLALGRRVVLQKTPT